MDPTHFLILVLCCHGMLFFFDRFFKSCSMYPYIAFLQGTGLSVGYLRLSWRTTAFNRTLVKIGTKYKSFLHVWFDIGLYVSLLLLPVAIGLVIFAAAQWFTLSNSSSRTQHENLIIDPMIPGITSPLNEIVYYVVTLAISSCVHELGHAIAAVREDVHVTEIGFNLIFILPVTFVVISNEQLSALNVRKKLRVLCAGVWHNLVIAAIAYVLFLALPILLTPFYVTNRGVCVTEIGGRSPLRGVKGLEVGDVIVGINEHKVRDDASWVFALTKTIKDKPGYCVETDFVHALDESVPIRHETSGLIECCEKDHSRNLCFEYIEASDGIVELPPHMCLPARKIVEHAKTLCYQGTCSLDLHCIKPVLQNTTSLLSIRRFRRPHVIYIGHPSDIYRTISVSSYVPKTWFLGPRPAESVELLLKYLVVFSLGLVLVNIIPCWFLDGQHIVVALVQLLLARRVRSKLVRDVIALCLTILGTLFLSLAVIGALWMNIFK